MNTCIRLAAQLRLISVIKNYSNIRQIYSPASIGLSDYITVREKYARNSKDAFEKFRQRLVALTGENEREMVYTEDLKQMIHIAEPTNEDLELITKMLSKFQKQNAALRFGNFVFGPVIMRMYHYMEKPGEALKAYYNPELDGMFDQLASYIVLMDLLFKSKMFEEVVNVYKTMREKQLTFGKYPKNLMVLLFGALYKLNTEASHNYMLELWKEINETGHTPVRRVTCFAAALALNHNNPHICLEILSTIPNQNFILVRSLKASAYCALGRTGDALPILAAVLCVDMPNAAKHTFPRDVVSTVREHVEKEDRKELTFEFNRLEKQLKDYGHISDNTFDEIMCAEISTFNPVDRQRSVIRATFHDAAPKTRIKLIRPGLQELV